MYKEIKNLKQRLNTSVFMCVYICDCLLLLCFRLACCVGGLSVYNMPEVGTVTEVVASVLEKGQGHANPLTHSCSVL